MDAYHPCVVSTIYYPEDLEEVHWGKVCVVCWCKMRVVGVRFAVCKVYGVGVMCGVRWYKVCGFVGIRCVGSLV